MPSPHTRVALYVRVSTTDKGQDTENQLRQMREFCERHGYLIYKVYEDHESGRKGRRQRTAFASLLEDAARGRFDLVLFWSLDRFSREGIRKTIHYLQHLDGWGVRFKSLTEPYLDTSSELVAHILIGVLSYLAELEVKKISERTKAGLARVRAQGKVLGRPSPFEVHRPVLVQMRAHGCSQQEMSRVTGLSYNTVKKYLRLIVSDPPPPHRSTAVRSEDVHSNY